MQINVTISDSHGQSTTVSINTRCTGLMMGCAKTGEFTSSALAVGKVENDRPPQLLLLFVRTGPVVVID